MILGIGTDIVNIQRIETIFEGDTVKRFEEKYFHPTEIATANKFASTKDKACGPLRRGLL